MHKPGWVPEHSDLPEAVDQRQNFPEVVPTSHLQAAQSFYEQDKHLAPDYSQHVAGHSYHPVTPATDFTESSPPERRLLGLRRRTFFIVAAILVLIAVGLGVGLGVGLTRSDDQESDSTPSPSGVPGSGDKDSSNVFQGSSLAATNYTDSDNYIHLYVFFQAENEELLASTWDSQNETWATVSISKIFSDTGLNLDLISATPIAAYTYLNPTFQTRVYFLTTGNSIREIVTSEDPTLRSGWRQGVLGSSKLITAGRGSKLAALRPQCGTGLDCRVNFPSMAVAYQGEDGVIALSRADDYEPMDIEFGPARRGAAIGLTSVMRDNITDIGWRLFFNQDGNLQEYTSEGSLSGWSRGESTGFAPDAGEPNIAAFSYDLVNIMIVNIDPDDDLEVRIWDTDSWSSLEAPNLSASDEAPEGPKFTAVAGNSQRRVFGIADGIIHQWEFFSLSPLQWSYRGIVPTVLES
ncbi:hypothetical protein C7999DRAFT_43073 [Corynascus novoguineensis]|uniref:Fucose-specific lectin n=1 Tax=Corynascus novoguineensis TaxID=1126955 RepID=A0AAN7CQJ5_9PEZI|nr:hypothetical protein C7999DRAFT_43073 [Corynascus novoguineensis]